MADFYFGNLVTGLRKRPAPETGMGASAVGSEESLAFANGGAYVTSSDGTHREFSMSWPVQEKSVMAFLNEYRNGQYGAGLLYMVDPFATNAMPPHWATPGLTCQGWPSLVGPSNKPTLAPASVVTNLVTNPNFDTAGPVTTVRTNLATNPRVASATAMGARWFGTGGGAGTTTWGNAGGALSSQYARKTWTVASSQGNDVGFQSSGSVRFAGTPGQIFTISAYMRHNSGVDYSAIAGIQPYDAAGTAGTVVWMPSGTTVTSEWTRISGTFTLPADTASFIVIFSNRGNWAGSVVGGTLDFSALLVEQSPTLGDYFDGTTAAAGEYTYGWSGTANASTSVQQAPTVVGASVSPSQGVVWQGVENGDKILRARFTPTGAFGISGFATTTAGPHTFLFRARTSWTGSLRVRNGGAIQTEVLTPVVAGVWKEHRVLVPEGASGVANVGFVGRNGDGWVGGDMLEVEHLLIIPGNYTGPYFDGSTKFLSGNAGEWTGTPNASTSTLALTSGYNMPNNGAKYSLTGIPGSVPERKLTLLIPEDRDLYLGFSGVASGAAVRMQTVTRDGAYGPVQDLTLLDPNGTIRLNTKVSGGAYSAVQVYLTATVAGAATVNLVSSKAVYALPTETPDLTGDHMPGEGHTGLRFSAAPTMTYIQAVNGRKKVSAAASFTEIEAWL